jgi:uncharacterized protein (DUF2147 family)
MFAAAAPSALFATSLAAQPTPVGKWKTVDDATGEDRSIVVIWEERGKLLGRVERILPKPGKDPDPRCNKCSGANKDKTVKGMTILWDMTRDGNEWTGGHIMDLENGSVYRSKLRPTVFRGDRKG